MEDLEEYPKMIKRGIDIVVSGLLLVLLGPLMLLIALAILISLGWPIFYVQRRPGKSEKIFSIYKFRTLPVEEDELDKVEPLGVVLRKLSLDELPQFFNVLKGDMSLVGPRPLLIKYLPYYTDEERERFEVRPGITGLSQISGRNGLGWTPRLAMDTYYVRNRSFLFDLVILVKTPFYVMRMKGVKVNPTHEMRDLEHERSEIIGSNQV